MFIAKDGLNKGAKGGGWTLPFPPGPLVNPLNQRKL